MLSQITDFGPVHVPITFFEKAGDLKTSRRFAGFVTTEHRDLEGEIALQDGLDFETQFMKAGWFNDNHSKETGGNIGYPVRLEKRSTKDGKKGTYVEGHLIRGYPRADAVWDLGRALQAQNAPRKLGFSVEGTIFNRSGIDNKIIAKALVRNVAITATPINPYTGMECLTKALMAGGSILTPTPSPGEGFPLRTESLEGTKKKKRLTKAAAMELMLARGYSRVVAEKVLEIAENLERF